MTDKKENTVLVRLSDKEKAVIKGAASLVNMTISDLIRQGASDRARIIIDTAAKVESIAGCSMQEVDEQPCH